MARFCARVRKRADLPTVSIKDIYRHPTISGLATALRGTAPTRPAGAVGPQPSRTGAGRGGPRQHAAVLACAGAAAADLPRRTPPSPRWSSVRGFEWISAGPAWWRSTCGRCVYGAAAFVVAVHAADPGEVAADRSVEAAADPGLEPGLLPVLAGQDAGPVQPAGRCSSAPRCTRCTCGRWARRSDRGSRSSPGPCRSAPTCSPSAPARSSARTPPSPATGPTHGMIQTGPVTLGKDVSSAR